MELYLLSALSAATDADNRNAWIDNLLTSLDIFWKGMLAIVIVIGIIIAVTYVLLKISERRKNDGKDNDKQ